LNKKTTYYTIIRVLKRHLKIGAICLLILMTLPVLSPNIVANTSQQQPKVEQQQAKKSPKKKKNAQQKKQQKKQAERKKAREKRDAEIEAKKNAPVGTSPIREEVQRYMGYEILTERYLSLPYDISMNTNVIGGFVDIGYFLLMFLPVLLLLGFLKKPQYGFLIMIVSIVLLSISTITAYSAKRGIKQTTNAGRGIDRFLEKTTFEDFPVSYICAHVYQQLFRIYEPIHKITIGFRYYMVRLSDGRNGLDSNGSCTHQI